MPPLLPPPLWTQPLVQTKTHNNNKTSRSEQPEREELEGELEEQTQSRKSTKTKTSTNIIMMVSRSQSQSQSQNPATATPTPTPTPTPSLSLSLSPEQKNATATTATMHIQLPTFSPADALAWFQRAEVIFRTKRVTSSTRKADHVLASLPEDIFPILSPWLLSKEDQEITFEETKQKLLTIFTPTPEERAKRLLQMSRQTLAGHHQRPSAAYEEMRALATLPDKRPLDLVRVLWLLRLPDTIRDSLVVDFMDKEIETLTASADSRLAMADAATAAPAEGPVKKKRTRPYCWYHSRFGDSARICIPPCTYPKNA